MSLNPFFGFSKYLFFQGGLESAFFGFLGLLIFNILFDFMVTQKISFERPLKIALVPLLVSLFFALFLPTIPPVFVLFTSFFATFIYFSYLNKYSVFFTITFILYLSGYFMISVFMGSWSTLLLIFSLALVYFLYNYLPKRRKKKQSNKKD